MKKWKWRNPLPKETKRDTIEDKHLARKILLYEHEECDQRREEALEERTKEILEEIDVLEDCVRYWKTLPNYDPMHTIEEMRRMIKTKYGL